jgi:hypothetical protein
MRAIIWSALAALVVSVNASWAQDSGKAVAASGAQPQADSAAAGAEKSPGETWRYRKHQGLWWYWLPSNKWVYWTDNRWVPYEAESYAKFNAARRPQPQSQAYSNSGSNPTWGNWGPIRYNQWGQRQYPYSQRSSGLQQLGPVPAPGGVRSLPGWGGER